MFLPSPEVGDAFVDIGEGVSVSRDFPNGLG